MSTNIERLREPRQLDACKTVFDFLEENRGRGYFTPFQLEIAFDTVRLPHPPALMVELQGLFTAGADGTGKCFYDGFEDGVFGTRFPPLHVFVLRVRMFIDLFKVFDRDGSGTISATEFGRELARLFRWRPTHLESTRLLAAVGDSKGNVSFAQFLAMLNPPVSSKPSELLLRIQQDLEELHVLFRCFDIDSTETRPDFSVTVTEFSKVMRSLGHHITDEYLQTVFDQVDTDGSGELSFDEFADIITASERTEAAQLIVTRCTELQQLFKLFDRDGGGELSEGELMTIFQRLGRKPAPGELLEAMGMGGAWQPWSQAVGDEVAESSLDFPGLVAMLSGERTLAQRTCRRQIHNFRRAFELFDADCSGSIGLDEFSETLLLLGHTAVPSAQIEARVALYAKKEEGEIDFLEFLAMMVSDDAFIMKEIKSHLVGFREAFDLFDRSGEGTVTSAEFLRSWRFFGFEAAATEVEEMLTAADTDGSGVMDFNEFVFMVANSTGEISCQIQMQLQEMREVFSMFDPDGDGAISGEEVSHALIHHSQLQVDEEEANQLLIDCDDDGNGELSFSEFASMMAVSHHPEDFEPVVSKESEQVQQGTEILKELITMEKHLLVKADLDVIRQQLAVVAGHTQFDNPSVTTVIGRELCRAMTIREYKPFERIVREGKEPSANWLVLLEGSCTAWRVNQDEVGQEGVPIEEVAASSTPKVRTRTQIAAHVAHNIGAIPSRTGMCQGVSSDPVYKASLWGPIASCIADLQLKLKKLQDSMPSVPEGVRGSEGADEIIRQLMSQVTDMLHDLRVWHKMGQSSMQHDQDDMRREEELLAHGAASTKQAYTLYLKAASTRKQLLFRKFYLQLKTYEADCVPRIELPLSSSNATKLERQFNRRQIAYIVTDGDGDIMHSSSEYTALTGYLSYELRGVNPRLLQGTKTNATQKQQMRQFVKKASTDKTWVIANYTRKGTLFWNSTYMVPIRNFDGSLDKWLAASVDVTDVRAELLLKPVVQAAIDTCRRVEHLMRRALHQLGPVFGSPGWEKPDSKQSEMRRELAKQVNLRTDEEFLGELSQRESTCDLSVRSRVVVDAPSSLYAGEAGAVVIRLGRQPWLQAHALEPVAFLNKMPRFSSMTHSQLAPIATKMVTLTLERGDVLCSTGQPVSHVWFVREGQIDLRIRVGKDKKPLKFLTLGTKDRSSCLRQPPTQSYAQVGAGDVIDQAQLIDGKWIANCDAVALTREVFLYKLDRAQMPWLAKDGGVHSQSVMEPRRRQRKNHLQTLDVVAGLRKQMMCPAPSPSAGEADLCWTGYSRLPGGFGKLKEYPTLQRTKSSPVLPPPMISNVVLPAVVPKVRQPIQQPTPVPVSPLPEGKFHVPRGRRVHERGGLHSPCGTEGELGITTRLPAMDGLLGDVDLDEIDEGAWDEVVASLDDQNGWRASTEEAHSLFPRSELEDIIQYNMIKLANLKLGVDVEELEF